MSTTTWEVRSKNVRRNIFIHNKSNTRLWYIVYDWYNNNMVEWKMKLNKWVKENGKWSEAKCLKFYADKGDDKNYTSILMRASKLNNIDIHYLVNTLEDILMSSNLNVD